MSYIKSSFDAFFIFVECYKKRNYITEKLLNHSEGPTLATIIHPHLI